MLVHFKILTRQLVKSFKIVSMSENHLNISLAIDININEIYQLKMTTHAGMMS